MVKDIRAWSGRLAKLTIYKRANPGSSRRHANYAMPAPVLLPPGLSIVIPVYRADQSLKPLYQSLIDFIPTVRPQFEIIFVEDCGGDQSWQVIEYLASLDRRVTGLRLSRNFGQHSAIICGVRAAQYDTVVTMDDDLQHPATEVPKLLSLLATGHDVVYGVPVRGEHGFMRVLASKITNRLVLASVLGARPQIEAFSAFRAFKTRLRDGFVNYDGAGPSVDVLLSWGTHRLASTRVEFLPRQFGESNYTLTKLIRLAFSLFAGFSTLPLHLASGLGFVFAMFGFAMLVWVLIAYAAFGAAVPGFTFLASLVSLFAGTQLMVLGLLGEYVARIYFRTMRQPTYIVAETTADARDE